MSLWSKVHVLEIHEARQTDRQTDRLTDKTDTDSFSTSSPAFEKVFDIFTSTGQCLSDILKGFCYFLVW